jgi:hypothetical protein
MHGPLSDTTAIRWDGAQQFAGGLVDHVDFAAIGAQVLELQQVSGMLDGGCEAREGDSVVRGESVIAEVPGTPTVRRRTRRPPDA